MSTESEFNLDKLFLPSWAQESPAQNKYAHHSGEDRSGGRRDSGGDRRPRPSFGGGGGSGGPRGAGGGGGGSRPPRPGGGAGGPRSSGGPDRPGFRRDGQRGPNRGDDRRAPERRPYVAPQPLPELNVSILPDDKGVELLAKQIKITGRAYPLFQIAKMILDKVERQQVRYDSIKRDGKSLQPIFVCQLDETLWLSEAEAVSHVLDKHFATFYQADRVQIDPPKGVFTFVAQCSITGTILGPPNYHGYQEKLRQLHTSRFARVPFEEFKSRIKIVRDEAVVKQWMDEQSWRTEYTTLNVPEADVKKFTSRSDLEQHFRTTHLPTIIKTVDTVTINGGKASKLSCRPLVRLAGRAWEQQLRNPLQVVNYLSQQFAQRGLQFFKVNKHITHVAIARPSFLDMEASPVSDAIKKIVDYIDAHTGCNRRDLIEALAPSPKAAPAPKPAEGEEAKEGAAAETPKLVSSAPTPAQTAIIGDLHWLIHQGHVIEFANGIMETAKKPRPRVEPAPKAAKPTTAAKGPAAETAPAAEATESAGSEADTEFSAAEVADLKQSSAEAASEVNADTAT